MNILLNQQQPQRQISSQEYQEREINLWPILFAHQTIILPLLFFIPTWIFFLNVGLVFIVYFSQIKRQFKINSWIKNIITLFAAAGVYFSFHQLSGRDAGVALITTMYCLKLLEIKKKRDVYVLMLLGFFMLLAGFLFNQSLWIALYQIIPVAAILNALISIHSLAVINASQINSLQYSLFDDSFKKSIKSLLKSLLLALPLMVVLFLFFPRLSGPIWKMPGGKNASSGISDTMSPGEISQLHLSEKIAFRVKFYGETPSAINLYWRSLVLDSFDGITWSRNGTKKTDRLEKNKPSRIPINVPLTQKYSYEISLEKTNQHWLTFLDRATLLPKGVFRFYDFSVKVEHRLTERTRYKAESIIDLPIDLELSDSLRKQNTLLPKGFNPRSSHWAKQHRKLYTNDRDFILSILKKINQDEYFYTLSPPIMMQNMVDDFWFNQQKGFCEHYAGALVFLARAANIPARVVIGYQGAEKNPFSDYWIVRYANAHAWTEIWFEGKGWIRIDPTAAIDSSRIEKQLHWNYAQRDSLFDDFGFESVDLNNLSFTKEVEYWLDKVNTGWNDWILDYNKNKQRRVFENLGLERLSRQQIVVLMIALCALFLVFISFKWKKNKPSLEHVEQSFKILLNKLSAYDINLSDNQGVYELILMMTQRQAISHTKSAKLNTVSVNNIVRLLKLYVFLRYQTQQISQKQQNSFRQQVKALKIQTIKP